MGLVGTAGTSALKTTAGSRSMRGVMTTRRDQTPWSFSHWVASSCA
jgi:hypothetical protein